jgi:hypothetical protein
MASPFSPLPAMPVAAGGEQCGVCHRGERRFRVRKLAVNLRFTLSRSTVGGAPCRPLSALVCVVRCA